MKKGLKKQLWSWKRSMPSSGSLHNQSPSTFVRNMFSEDPFLDWRPSVDLYGKLTASNKSFIHKDHPFTSNHTHTTHFSSSHSHLSHLIYIFKGTNKWRFRNMLVMPLTISRGWQKGLNDLWLAHFILEKERLEAVQHSAAQHKWLLLIHHRHQQDNNSWPAQTNKTHLWITIPDLPNSIPLVLHGI